MNHQSATYPQSRQRTDWSSEIKAPSGNAREASSTGLGGMEREAQASGAGTERGAQASGDWLYQSGDSHDALSVADSASGVRRASGNGRQAREEQELQSRLREDEAQERLREREAQDRLREQNADALSGPQVMNGQEMSAIWPNIENHLSNDVIEAPTTMEEVYRGSMKALLLRNIGNYVVATFLIGTQTTVSWEGILYDVGNDYLAIYQSGRDQYIVSDLYSLKYVEFYDTRRRELCDSLLTAQEPSGNSQRP